MKKIFIIVLLVSNFGILKSAKPPIERIFKDFLVNSNGNCFLPYTDRIDIIRGKIDCLSLNLNCSVKSRQENIQLLKQIRTALKAQGLPLDNRNIRLELFTGEPDATIVKILVAYGPDNTDEVFVDEIAVTEE